MRQLGQDITEIRLVPIEFKPLKREPIPWRDSLLPTSGLGTWNRSIVKKWLDVQYGFGLHADFEPFDN